MAESLLCSDSILDPILESDSILQSDLPVIGNETIQNFESEIENSQNSQDSVDSVNSQNSGNRVCEFEMIQGKRRDRTVLHSITENQLYVRNKVLANGSVAYTCKVKNCKSRLYVKDGCCFFAEPFHGHLHGNKKDEICELKVIAQIKEKCAKPTASQTTSQISEVREIFDNAVME